MLGMRNNSKLRKKNLLLDIIRFLWGGYPVSKPSESNFGCLDVYTISHESLHLKVIIDELI